ncbi:NCS1 nucleoside transporter family [Mycena crocata]|nr:NCS1 nucleoside transporter family [Mycena crocata]
MLPFDLQITSKEADGDKSIVSQPDLLPVPQSARTWGAIHLVGCWVAESFGIQYQVASTAVAAGLSPGTALGALFLGHVLVSLACACNGFVGATYGINFLIFARASFGIRGNITAVLCRAISAVLWFGTTTYQGGQCVQVMLQAIWPSFKSFPNHLPLSAHVTSSQLLSFFLFYIIQLPLLLIHISKLRHLFMLKAILMPIFGLALFGWAVGRAHGFGPIFQQKTDVRDSSVALVFLSAMTSAIAGKTTLALNICASIFLRAVVWTTILSLSFLITLCSILGVVVTSATQVIYGVSTWNPLQVCELWSSRAAQFFAALCWALTAVATNIGSNSTAVGNDLAILFPKYINIRRGQYICAILALATCPVDRAGYSIFLGPICGILLADYFVLRRRVFDIAALYHKDFSPYWYTHGFNPRAILVFILALVPNLPGFAERLGGTGSPTMGAAYIFITVYISHKITRPEFVSIRPQLALENAYRSDISQVRKPGSTINELEVDPSRLQP